MDPRASPLRADSLVGVAPAVIVNASHDPLCSAAEEYAVRLASAGALLRVTTHKGVMHDWYLRFQYKQSDVVWEQLADDVKKVFSSLAD
jgi:acetyl esterase